MPINVNKAINFTGHAAGVFALAQANEPHLFYSGSSDKIIALWNLKTGVNEKFNAQLPSYVYSICFIPETNYLIAGTFSGNIHIIDLIRKREIKNLQQHKGAIFDLKFLPNKNLLIAASADGSSSFTDLSDLSCKKIIKLCEEKVRNATLNMTKTQTVFSCGDGTLRIFDNDSLTEIHRFDAHKLSANIASFHPSEKYLLTGGRDAMMRVWDVENNFLLLTEIAAHNWALYDIVFSPDGKLFATASRDKTFKIWNSSTFELLKVINKEKNDSHRSSVNKLLWSRYNNLLISASDDRSIMAWSVTQQ